MNKTLKIFLTFLFLFLMNLLLFKVLAGLSFKVTMGEKTILYHPCFHYMIDKKLEKVRNINHYIF